MKLIKLNSKGFDHVLLVVVIMVLSGLVGTYLLVQAHAASTSPGASAIKSGFSGSCLDDWHNGKTSGNVVDIYLCNNSAAQKWLLEGDGTLRLDDTHCVGAQASGGKLVVATNSPVGLYDCQSSTASISSAFQQWRVSGTQLLNVASGLCLTAPTATGTSPPRGTQLVLSTCLTSNPANQQWIVPVPPAMYEPANGNMYIGVSTSSHGSALSTFDTAAGIASHPAIFNDYTPANGDMQNQFTNNAHMPAGITPMVSWNLTMQDNVITNGSKDAYIEAMANEAKAFGKPVFIRLDWEMNGGWYNNYDQKGGTTPAMFVASWQHVYTLFKSIAPNAAFVWCPNNGEFSNPSGIKTPNDSWYPGDSYVDWVGVDVYPQYDHTPTDVTTKAYGLNWFTNFSSTHHKPLMVAEYGMGGQIGTPTAGTPDSSTTFDIIFPWAESNPTTVKALVYFDFGSNHALENNPIGAAAYRSYTVGKSQFLYQLP